MEALAIRTIGLTKRYGNFYAVHDLNLCVHNGEYMGLLGPNGAGKSTTLKAITGLVKPSEGTITIHGIDTRDHKEAMSRVGCVIETPESYPNFTPSEILQYIGRIYGMDNREIAIRARDSLEMMKMWEWRNKPIGGFSKGMRQRVTIAQAIMPNPDILILDEPTSGLDPRGMIEVRQVLANMRRNSSMSLLISTHILSEVSELCNSVCMIRDGRSVISGSVSDLVNGVFRGDSVTLELKTLRPLTQALVNNIQGCQGVSSAQVVNERMLRVEFSGNSDQQAYLADMIFNSGLGVLALNEKGADLEDLYMELTKGERVS